MDGDRWRIRKNKELARLFGELDMSRLIRENVIGDGERTEKPYHLHSGTEIEVVVGHILRPEDWSTAINSSKP